MPCKTIFYIWCTHKPVRINEWGIRHNRRAGTPDANKKTSTAKLRANALKNSSHNENQNTSASGVPAPVPFSYLHTESIPLVWKEIRSDMDLEHEGAHNYSKNTTDVKQEDAYDFFKWQLWNEVV
jgi:hypothetical protein